MLNANALDQKNVTNDTNAYNLCVSILRSLLPAQHPPGNPLVIKIEFRKTWHRTFFQVQISRREFHEKQTKNGNNLG